MVSQVDPVFIGAGYAAPFEVVPPEETSHGCPLGKGVDRLYLIEISGFRRKDSYFYRLCPEIAQKGNPGNRITLNYSTKVFHDT